MSSLIRHTIKWVSKLVTDELFMLASMCKIQRLFNSLQTSLQRRNNEIIMELNVRLGHQALINGLCADAFQVRVIDIRL